MSRTKKNRIIQCAPNFRGFKPFGVQKTNHNEIKLSYEEYEAMKLCDYDNLKHRDASLMMKISRPTFTRIYQSARHKLATALVEVAVISIEGGKVIIDLAWFYCNACKVAFSISGARIPECPLCRSKDVTENK